MEEVFFVFGGFRERRKEGYYLGSGEEGVQEVPAARSGESEISGAEIISIFPLQQSDCGAVGSSTERLAPEQRQEQCNNAPF
jgi:hypothetical protein